MNTLLALLKKETMEFNRTYKLLILFAVFLILAILSPLAAKFMPDIMAQFLPKEIAESFPTPSALDSWAQFFKNFSQIGLFVIALLFAGMIIHERNEGTLIILLTKGLHRSSVVLAKSLFAMLIWTIMYWISFSVTYFYTWYYWRDEHVPFLAVAVSHLWLFGLLLIAVILFGNVLFKSIYANLLWTALFVGIWFVVSIFPKTDNFNLLKLATNGDQILQGLYSVHDYKWIYMMAIGSILFIQFITIQIFNKKSIN